MKKLSREVGILEIGICCKMKFAAKSHPLIEKKLTQEITTEFVQVGHKMTRIILHLHVRTCIGLGCALDTVASKLTETYALAFEL